jgi:hypothetical protein
MQSNAVSLCWVPFLRPIRFHELRNDPSAPLSNCASLKFVAQPSHSRTWNNTSRPVSVGQTNLFKKPSPSFPTTNTKPLRNQSISMNPWSASSNFVFEWVSEWVSEWASEWVNEWDRDVSEKKPCFCSY